MTARVGMLLVVAMLALACAPAASVTPTPDAATPPASAASELDAFVAEACADTTYENCAEGLAVFAPQISGSLVAVCEYPDGQGDVVIIETEADAESMCSADGLIEGSTVRRVLTVP